ncbi:MAG TPA: hypothetical protein VF765_16030 [Polyangiaceae bacterium]
MGARKTRYAAVRWAAIAVGLGAAASYTGQPGSTAHAATEMHLYQAGGPTVPPPASGQHGEGKKSGGQFKDSAVYVDGKAKGILSYGELPSTLVPSAQPEIDDLDVARYYRLADYLEAVGVDLSRVREMHVYGSHDRVAVITGEELRTQRDKLLFDFTQQTAGKPRARWAQTHALKHRPMVDVILGISLYVDKTPPAYVKGELLVDGQPVEGIPYVDDGIPKGTRVYVDGRLDGWVRRKTLPDKLIAPGSTRTHAKFSMDAFIGYVGGDTRNVKAVDFYDGDTLLARVDGKAWHQTKGEYVFELTNRSHGQVVESFPGDKTARISSVQLYVRTTPPDRHPDPEALEPQAGGSDEPQSGGGNGDGTGGNNGVTQDSAAARGVNEGASEEEF